MRNVAHIEAVLPRIEPLPAGGVSKEELRSLLDACPDAMGLVELPGWKVIYGNSTLFSLVSQPINPPDGESFFHWFAEDSIGEVRDRLSALAAGEVDAVEFVSRLMTDGGPLMAEVRACRATVAGRSLVAIVVRKSGVGSSGRTGRDGSRIDPLTGLVDRSFVIDRLTSLLQGERSRDHQCAVLFVDVDGFKQVNDAYGHLVGDQVLCEVANRLAECVRSDDHVARFGGDEFVVLLESVCGRAEIQPVLARIDTAFERPFKLPHGNVALRVSVGVAEAGRHKQTAEELLGVADRAMYAAKPATT